MLLDAPIRGQDRPEAGSEAGPKLAAAADDEHTAVEARGLMEGSQIGIRGAPEGLSTEDLGHLMVVRAALKGLSVVDRGGLWFTNRAEVDRFLRLSEFDTDNPLDLQRLSELHREATLYLTETHRYRLPKEIEQPKEIHDIFLCAVNGSRRLQRFACMTLKVMHIMHHVAARELVFNQPVSEAELSARLNAKVYGVVDRMRQSGIQVHEFATGTKSRTSLVTKLLAKRSTIASQIFDKLRFRAVVQSREDVVKTIAYLGNHLFPINFVVPGQSQNDIIGSKDISEALQIPLPQVAEVWGEAESAEAQPVNEFSGSNYRCVNFVADIPLRIDDLAPDATPAIAFAQAEIQLLDAETAAGNETGDSAHALYKKRQRARVRRRLEGNFSDS